MDQAISKLAKLESLILTGVFLVLIFLPLVDHLLDIDTSIALREMRTLRAMPTLDFTRQSIESFPQRFEGYFNDHFGFRNRLIRCNAWVHYFGFGVSSSPKVTLGKEDWLYLSEVDDYYRSVDPYTPEELDRWQACFEYRKSWLAERGIRYLFTLAPSKHSLYPEYLPDAMNKVGKMTRLDQLAQRLSQDPHFLDMRGPLLDAKKDGRVFEITGTHWTHSGTYVVYQEIISRLAEWFPQIKATPFEDFKPTQGEGDGLGLAQMLGLEKLLAEDCSILNKMSNGWTYSNLSRNDGKKPSLNDVEIFTRGVPKDTPRSIIFRDSFTNNLLPFLSSSFNGIFYVWRDDFDPDLILTTEPTLVIHMIAERKIHYLSPERIFAVSGEY